MHMQVERGNEFKATFSKQYADLTQDMIASGAWREMDFKPLRFDVDGRVPDSGFLHPLLKVIIIQHIHRKTF